MKRFISRPLRVFAVLLAVIVGGSLLVSTSFTADLASLRIPVLDGPEGTAHIGRMDRGTIPSQEELDARGYDTALEDGYAPVLAGEGLTLLFREEDGAVALRDETTGQVWTSVPPGLEEQEVKLAGTAKTRLLAQVILTYYDASGSLATMDSYNDSVAYGGMSSALEGDRFTVSYHFGKVMVTLAEVPQQMSKERFEGFLARLPEKEARELKNQYGLVSGEGKSEESLKKLQEQYPNIANADVYYLKFDNPRILAKVKAAFETAGYTAEDLRRDNEENGVETEAEAAAGFDVTLVYTLENRGLAVSADTADIRHSGASPVATLTLLPLFGAGEADDLGYILVPDGSGALIGFSTGKAGEPVFSMPVYGTDTAVVSNTGYQVDEKLSLPVFGIKKNRGALLCAIEEGESLATINASLSGQVNSFHTVSATFTATAYDTVTIAKNNVLHQQEPSPYDGRFTLSYTPVTEQEESYAGMAALYRQKLLARGALGKSADQSYRLLADIVCGVPGTRLTLGIPTDAILSLTTFDQAGEILAALEERGVAAACLLEGWGSGGLDQAFAAGLSPLSEAGGREGFRQLASLCGKGDVPLYPLTRIATCKTSGNGFSPSGQSIRTISRDLGVLYEYDYVSRYRAYNNRLTYQLSPAYFGETAETFLKKTGGALSGGLGVADLGSLLFSDYNVKKSYHRQAAAEEGAKALALLAEEKELYLSNPNLYALRSAGAIGDMPCEDSLFTVCTAAVPFYQMVVRGSLTYYSRPLNQAADYRTAFLKAVECGAGLQYTFTYSRTSLLKNTDYAYLCSGDYQDWMDTAAQDYRRAAAVLSLVAGEEMVSHARVTENVYRTGYQNGVAVYVNYGSEEASVDGLTVGPQDFAVRGAGR